MLQLIQPKDKKLSSYKKVIGEKQFKEIKRKAKDLKGLRVAHINATARGGGVSEILRYFIPLLRDLGIKAEWYVLPFNEEFFKITKQFHNAMQGGKWKNKRRCKRVYHNYLKSLCPSFSKIKADIWVIHDPQALALIECLEQLNQSQRPIIIWRCHIDTSRPNKNIWKFLLPYINKADKMVFTMHEFAYLGLDPGKIEIIAPAIDPLSPKNMPMNIKKAKKIAESFGIDAARPLAVQVSRFDPWKDPIGVIKAFKKAKKKIKGLQLAYLGMQLAVDDPEAVTIFQKARKAARRDKDIHLFFDPSIVPINLSIDEFVNVFQTAADVILQKSVKEGYALTVAEAMWKGKPVIGGAAGGIKRQIKHGKNGILVDSIAGCAREIVHLIKDKKLSAKLGREARQFSKKNSIITRLLRDHIRLYKKLMRNKKESKVIREK